jgi:hypothetical protein
METDATNSRLRLTVDEIGPDPDDQSLAALVTDEGDLLYIPLHLLPDGTKVGDVLLASFEQEPDERQRRLDRISELQRRLFGD